MKETPASKKSVPQADSQEADASVDSGPAPLGAGMPNVPIHRADAGAKARADATPTGTDTRVTDAAVVSVGTMLDAGDADAGPHATVDAGQLMPPSAAPPLPLHRYSFSGTGTSVPDQQGGKAALIRGDAKLDGKDVVDFNAMGNGFVELPDDTFATVSDFSVLVWLYAYSNACWQRAFDLTAVEQVPLSTGGNDGPPNMPNMPSTRSVLTSLYLTPYGCPDALPTLGYVNSTSRYHLMGKEAVPQDQELLLGLTFNARSQTLRLIVNGVVKSEQRVAVDVRALSRARAWLGHSPTPTDPELDGSISELRVYASALDPGVLAQIYARGPDAL